MNTIHDVIMHTVPKHLDSQGELIAFENNLNFLINLQRIFIVKGHANSLRGRHAHINLTQILVCIQGACLVICDDGIERKEFVLDQANRAIVVPNGIWAEQIYLEEGTVLIVLCDLPYDESDYIRDYDAYLEFRKRAGE